MSKTAGKKSIAGAARDALRADKKQRAAAQDAAIKKTTDSLQNFAAALGIGTNNLMSFNTYGFNPITRIRTLIEWIHRGSWLGGVAVDLVADDMTKAGVEIKGSLEPEQINAIQKKATYLGIWQAINDCVKWSRLYGGCLGVMMIDGQNPSTPLRIETVSKDQFKGILPLDRWMVQPDLNNLITEYGPQMGLPKFYNVTANAPGFSNQKIHYSRCLRLEGIRLSYWQRIMENLWGISVYERLYDRMVMFDSATTGAAQLAYKAYLRTIGIKNFREVVAAGGPALQGLVKQIQMMREQQSIEGITIIDAEDEFEGSASASTAFSGLAELLVHIGQQIGGALQIPLVRLFGEAPAGMNSTGESDLRTYYDGINQRQNTDLLIPTTAAYQMIAASERITLPPDFELRFKPLWQLTEKEKSDIASGNADTITKYQSAGLMSDKTSMMEIKQQANVTNIGTNITQEDIDQADDEPAPSAREMMEASAGEGQEGAAGGTPKNKNKAKDSAYLCASCFMPIEPGTVCQNDHQ